MKILVIGNEFSSSGGDIAEEQEICKAINQLGHIGIFVNRDGWEKQDGEFDFVFVAKYVKNTNAEIDSIKNKFACPVIYWMPDHCPKLGLNSMWDNTFKKVDLWLGRDLDDDILNNINKLNGKYYYWNFDVACDIYKKEYSDKIYSAHPQTPFPEIVPINFIGNWIHNSMRMKFLYGLQKYYPDELHITTLTMKEYADGQMDGKESEYKLKNIHNPLYGSLFNKLVGITKINLSIDWVNSKGFWSPRTARTMAAGGFVLVKYVPDMYKTFGPDKENVVYFDTVKDCAAKIKYYLQNEDERKEIAKRGYKYVNEFMRPKHMVGELLKHIKDNIL